MFCVPGRIFDSTSSFTNRMIKEGAKLVADYTDILEELNLPDISSAGCDHGEQLVIESETTEERENEETEDLDPGEMALLAHLSGRAAAR